MNDNQSTESENRSMTFAQRRKFWFLLLAGAVGMLPISVGYLSSGGDLSKKCLIIKAIMGGVFGIAIMGLSYGYTKISKQGSKTKWGLLFCAGGLVGALGGVAMDGISKSGEFLINRTMFASSITGMLLGVFVIAIAAGYKNITGGSNYGLLKEDITNSSTTDTNNERRDASDRLLTQIDEKTSLQ